MAVDREGLREALAPVLADIWRAIECEQHPHLYRGQLLADAALSPTGPLSDLLTKADSAERMEVENDRLRASLANGAELETADNLAAAQADVARLSAEVEALRLALAPFAAVADRIEARHGDQIPDHWSAVLSLGLCREARAALSRTDEADSRERGALLAQADGGADV